MTEDTITQETQYYDLDSPSSHQVDWTKVVPEKIDEYHWRFTIPDTRTGRVIAYRFARNVPEGAVMDRLENTEPILDGLRINNGQLDYVEERDRKTNRIHMMQIILKSNDNPEETKEFKAGINLIFEQIEAAKEKEK